jgi:ATP synthase protein I
MLPARRVIQIQAFSIAALSVVVWGLFGPIEAGSAAVGGLAAFLPNLYFAIKFGRPDPKKSAQDVLKAFYVGEAVKLALTALLFALVFQIPGILVIPMFVGFIAVIMVFWFALLMRS